MPVARVDDYVAPAIRSVLSQQDVSVELILIGPLETDPAYAQLQELVNENIAHDERCQLIPRRLLGIANALNEGLQYAQGDYIARMDADDLCEPHRFKTQLATAFSYDNRCLVGAQVKIFSDDSVVLKGNQQYETWLNEQCTPDAITEACFVESPLPHPTWFAHQTIWTTLGPYKQGDFPEDYDYLLRAWLNKIPMVKPHGVLLHWREHPNRLTRTDTRYQRKAFIQLKSAALADANSGFDLDKGRSVWIAGTGRNARYWHDALENNNVKVAGFVELDNPKAKNQKRNKPVINYDTLASTLNNDLLITAITNANARNKLKRWCANHGFAINDNVVIGG